MTELETKRRASELLQRGRLDEAVQQYEELLATQRRPNPAILNLIGDIRIKQGDYGSGFECYLKAAKTYGEEGLFHNAIAVGKKILRLDPQRTFRSYVLTALDAPDAVDIRLTPDLREHRLMVTSTDNLGNYRVAAGGSASGVDLGFSVNLTPEQTRLDRLEDEALAAVLGPLEYRVARDRQEIEGGRSMQRIGRELFGLLIVLLAVALAAEHVVANRFYKD